MNDSEKIQLNVEDKRSRELAELANLITDYAMEHCFSFSTVMKSVELAKGAFLQAAIINKG